MSSPPPRTLNNDDPTDAELREEIASLRSEIGELKRTLTETREVIALAERTRILLAQQGSSVSIPSAGLEPEPTSAPDRVAPDQSPSEPTHSWQESAHNWLASQRKTGEWQPTPAWVWDILAVVVILIVAGVARYWNLGTIPLGLQGDEAAAGLEARRIMDVGWIGIFSPAASGNPTAFFYLNVPTVYVLGNEIISVRLTSATIDMVTVCAVYILLRRNFGFCTALIGSFLMAISAWHIHFARIAFMNILWPLCVVLGLIAFGKAHRTGNRIWWAISGAFLASGIYAYNGHFLFLAVVAAFLLLYFFDWQALVLGGILATLYLEPGNITAIATAIGAVLFVISPAARNWRRWLDALSFGAGFALVFAAMAHLMWTQTDRYFSRGRRVSVFNSDEWDALGSTGDQIHFLFERYVDFWTYLADKPNPDFIAGFGSAPIVPIAALALAAAGAILGLIRRNHPLILLSVMTVILMPIASITATDVGTDFALRRAMIIAPFLALLAALGAVELVRICQGQGKVLRYGSVIAITLLLCQIAYANLHGWFAVNSKSNEMHWVLSQELVEAAEYMDSLDRNEYVYFFSSRWPITHENIRYLAGVQNGETRGEPYGPDNIEFDPANGPGVVILMGDEQARLAEIQQKYPGGTVIKSDYRFHPTDGPAYIVYLLPELSPAASADTESP